MKVSELIEELNRMKDEHGDLEVKVYNSDLDFDINIYEFSKSENEKYITMHAE